MFPFLPAKAKGKRVASSKPESKSPCGAVSHKQAGFSPTRVLAQSLQTSSKSLILMEYSPILPSLFHTHFQGNRILAVQQRQLVVKFDVYLHRKSVTNFWCCLFSCSVSTLLCPTCNHTFSDSSGLLFYPLLPFTTLDLNLPSNFLSPAVILCLAASLPASLPSSPY